MKYPAIILMLLPALLCAQEFQFRQEFDTIPVEINGWHPFAPWTGGDSETSPEFCDIDADGDLDCFVGNIGYRITYFENIGTADSAQFKYVTRFFGDVIIDSIYAGRIDPFFVDIDDDGDFDLFSSCHGYLGGTVHFWLNTGTPQIAQFTWITDSLQGIQGTGESHIEFSDLDNDGDHDLFLGNSPGRIEYYQNIGTPTVYDFQLDTLQFQNIDVGERAVPCFVDIDADGDQDLFIGNTIGRIWFYRNDSDSANFVFTSVSNYYNNIDVVDAAAPDFVDLDGDGDQDLAVGRKIFSANSPLYGDVAFYQNIGTPQVAQWAPLSEEYLTWDEGGFLGNHGTDLDGDGDHDLLVALKYCVPDYLALYENVGSAQQASFLRVTDNYQDIHVTEGTPFLVDMDNDLDPDLFLGEAVLPNPPYPGLHYYQNIGDPQRAVFSLVSTNLVPWNYDVTIRPALTDIDADGDKDLFMTDSDGIFYFVENIGSPAQPIFGTPILNWPVANPGPRLICFADIDEDADPDLFLLNENYNLLSFYQNVGTPQNASMQLVTTQFFGSDAELLNPGGIDYFDVDADGDGDFIFSGGRGGMMFFRNITGEVSAPPPVYRHPQAGLQISLGPNPANPLTVVSCQFPVPSNISLQVFDISGRMVVELASGFHLPGEYRYVWDASGRAAGMYFVRLKTPQQSLSEKLTIIK